MQPGELVIVGEGQVEVHALQVGLAVLPAAEDAVVGLVDGRVVVGPQTRFGGGVHPRMHAARHEAGTEGRQQPVDDADLGLEAGGKGFERGLGADVLELDEMQHDLVGPAEASAIDVQPHASRGRPQQGVGDRHDRQRLAIHDHVFQLDAVARKGVQRRGRTHQALTRLRASMRRTNEPMISR